MGQLGSLLGLDPRLRQFKSDYADLVVIEWQVPNTTVIGTTQTKIVLAIRKTKMPPTADYETDTLFGVICQ